MSKLNWHTGNPPKSGFYLTTREMRPSKQRYVLINEWIGEDYPVKNKKLGWQTESLDNSTTIAWASVKDVEPYNK